MGLVFTRSRQQYFLMVRRSGRMNKIMINIDIQTFIDFFVSEVVSFVPGFCGNAPSLCKEDELTRQGRGILQND